MASDPKTFRRVLGHYPTGVCVVAAMQTDGKPVGMTVGSFTSVSLAPPIVGFFPDRSSTSWPRIAAARRFCANILAAHQEPLCRAFAARSDDKFAGIAYRLSARGAPILDDVVAWIDCDLYAVHEAGDHYLVLGEVQALGVERPHEPLLFFQGGYGRFSPLPPESRASP
jgi:3-hydroxy-9,10-secoandrosta-1,3,5(10)-triene-9,17-dione monooxygenase reductase component